MKVMGMNTSESPEADTALLVERIAATLRALVEVHPLEPDSLVARPGFWERCQTVVPGHESGDPSKRRVFVDGFRGAPQWNSLKVYRDALEPGLSLWCGYALYGGAWYHHAWCMLGQRIVETTVGWPLYYGAALLPDELEYFAARYGELDPNSRKRQTVETCKDGLRTYVWGDELRAFSETIGRERDWKTGEIKEGLGR
jgi:hypothetical protein